MPRPISATPPQQATDAVAAAAAHHVVELPSMGLPDFPEIPETPHEMPNVDAPGLPVLSLPEASTAAHACLPDVPAAELPDFLTDFIFEIA